MTVNCKSDTKLLTKIRTKIDKMKNAFTFFQIINLKVNKTPAIYCYQLSSSFIYP